MAKGYGGKEGLSGLISPRYVCCAIPVVNAGIYIVIAEQAILGIALGVAALTTPNVVGAVFPNFATIVFAITCWAVTLVQPVGFIGVLREKTSTFKIYSLLNALAVTAAFSTAAALIIVSALKHTEAVSTCKKNFYTPTNSTTTSSELVGTANSTLSAEGTQLCSPFAWADVGIMGILWLLLLLVQAYFLYVTRTYSTSQVSDHKLYHSVYSENPEAFTMSILRSTRYNPGSVYNHPGNPGLNADAWDARPSMDSARDEAGPTTFYGEEGYGNYGHARAYSDATVPAGEERYEDAYGDERGEYGHPQEHQGGYGQYPPAPPNHGGHYPFSATGGGYIDHPPEAFSRDPGQTPTDQRYVPGQALGWQGGGGLRRPDDIQNHPGKLQTVRPRSAVKLMGGRGS